MTRYLNKDIFWPTDRVDLDESVLASQEVISLATVMDTLGPLERASPRTLNVATVLHVTPEGTISKVTLTLCGKNWGRKCDAKRVFKNAPSGAKLVIKNLEIAGLDFPSGSKSSLWVPSTDFDWQINKGNHKDAGVFSDEELLALNIKEWVIRAHIVVNEDPVTATVRWLAIPIPLANLSSLPGDARLPGYPGIAVSDGQAHMAGVVHPETNCGLPFHPVLINEATDGSPICLPSTADVRESMIGFWSRGTEIRGLSAKDWHTATKGPEIPLSDNGVPCWAWPSAPDEEVDEEEDSEPSEDGSFTYRPEDQPGAAKYAGFRGGLCKGLYTAKSFPTFRNLSEPLLKALIQGRTMQY